MESVKQLVDEEDPAEFLNRLSEPERDLAYKLLLAQGNFKMELFRKYPSRGGFKLALCEFKSYYADGFGKAVKALAPKYPWVLEELTAAKKLPAAAETFRNRWVKKLTDAAPSAPKKRGDESTLLAAIAAAPDEDGPRAVYADWLLDRGESYGASIHTALALATKGEHPDRDAERKASKEWLAPIRPFLRQWAFERGLLSWVYTLGKLYVQAPDAIALRAPRAVLKLEGVQPEHIAAIAASPLGAFRSVMLYRQRLTDAQLTAIVSSPTLVGLDRLNVPYNKYTDAGVLALAKSRHLNKLRELNIDRNDQAREPKTIATVLREMPALKWLKASVRSLDGAFDGAKANLEKLELRIADGTPDAKAIVERFPKLVYLDIGYGKLAADVKKTLEKRRGPDFVEPEQYEWEPM